MSNFIRRLQEKPYNQRVKILWSTVGICAIILLVVFVYSIKNTLNNVDSKNLIEINPISDTAKTSTPYAAVERIESTDKNFKIYFNFNNTTDDILNISAISNITLRYNDQQLKPQSIVDRQNKPFVQKILSHTQNFGILVFQPVQTENATLTFDQMFFEKNPGSLFQQELELNISELSKTTKLRE